MPYSEITELPVGVKKLYSDKAQRAFMAAWNGVFAQTKDEQRAFAAAHAAARKVDGIKEVEVLDVTTDHEFQEASFHFDGGFGEGTKRNEESGVYEIPVTLIKPGLSKNKVHYGEGWLSKFAGLMEGKKAYLNHEKKSEIKDRQSRSVNDVAGWYSGVHQSEDMSVQGVLNLVETPRTEHVIKLAQANPELVGLSINARGKASRGKVNGENAMIAETVEKVFSTDIVTEAAAGGEMRMVASVLLDTEEGNMETDTKTNEDTESADYKEAVTAWLTAGWLFKETEYMNTAEWLIAEAQVQGAWLQAEKFAKDADIKTWLDAEMGEAIKDVPEDLQGALKELKVSEAIKMVESMKKVLPDKPPKSVTTEEEKKKPGEEGYKRHFL